MDHRLKSQSSKLTVSALERATDRFADLISTTDLDLPVPSCPEWVLEDLARHLGEVHQWAAGAVRTGTAIYIPASDAISRSALVDWYRQVAGDLVGLLARVGPNASAWVFGPSSGAGLSSFWLRRQVHETVMHTWDMLAAKGVFESVESTLAWDGVEEVRDVFYPRQVALGRIQPLHAALHLEPTDLDRPPVVIGFGEPVRVQLPASEILLALWHRTRPALGDPRAAALMSLALTP